MELSHLIISPLVSQITSAYQYYYFLSQEEIVGRGINGGVPCATCTILFSMATQLAEIYNETLIQSLDRFCGYLPVAYEVIFF
jgi:hypothetical protein